MLLLLALLTFFAPAAEAVFVNFDNCLDLGIVNSSPKQLQFTPYFLSAVYNTSTPAYNLNLTVYGNVSGQATEGTLPSADNTSYWNNPNETFGKIVDLSLSNNRYSTLFAKAQVLTYTPYDADPSRFCLSTVNTTCPISPSFYKNASNPYDLSAFTVSNNFYSSYAFASFATTLRVQSGDEGAPDLACISAVVTPDLGRKIADTLCYLPVAILALVACATVFAAIFSPWGSADPFRWTSNYGRDEDLLRLVTPGFGDCLVYVQFIVLGGSLNLAYPGYYQPAVSQAAWSTLLFNESFVTPGDGSYESLTDGLYFVNGTYGLSRLGQYVGMLKDQDIWAGMAVWYLGLTVAVILVCQVLFAVRWFARYLANTQEEDLRSKNLPFSVGVVVRMTFNYFLLPIVSISLFQMVVAGHSPASVVIMAVALLAAIIIFSIWIFRLIFTTKPRAHLFDDLPTLLKYGPLYNTYSDDAAPFAFIPILLNFVRGIAIGAIQPSGIAQIIVLAICEVIYILTLHAFRPFQAPTSMNAYHTFFSIVRLLTTLLSVAFVPNLSVSEASKGWIGYVCLFLHAIVLVFGFFLNAIQTIIEVSARLAGAGDARGGLSKVFGKRQLAQRTHRRGQRSSMGSNAAILATEGKMGTRSRSLSASSAVLLSRPGLMGDGRMSGGFDQFSQGDFSTNRGTSPEPGTPGGTQTPYSFLPSGSTVGGSSRHPTLSNAVGKNLDLSDPYYRPPRARRATFVDPYTPGARSRASGGSVDWSNKPYDTPDNNVDVGEESSFSPGRDTITPAYLKHQKDDSDPDVPERSRRPKDYAVRESDFYYGVTRGPALASSGVPTRKLKTGPADPMGPVSSAGVWIKGLFGGKRKEKGKGFEVVRSTRAPLMALGEEDERAPPVQHEPYQDSPEVPQEPPRTMSDDTTSSDEHQALPHPAETRDASRAVSPLSSEDEVSLIDHDDEPFGAGMERVSDVPPMLAPIETQAGIELPSRINSKASSKPSRVPSLNKPPVPRRSSKRTPSMDANILIEDAPRLSRIHASPSPEPEHQPEQVSANLRPMTAESSRLPFGSMKSSPSPDRSIGPSNSSSMRDPSTHHSTLSQSSSRTPRRVPTNEGERPVSTGFVHRHQASDGIQPGLWDHDKYPGTSAELVEEPKRSGSGSTRSTMR
ncbi:hypothetical protein K490DRAFT_54506 [Saccharata proteae CBS 121410]|uniref:ML-like domain-containing protein n=1 Tax=Saccharata proteae CBS 121410 TaxID=1314787 RepID=A0A9P4I0R8_9PEZI|nr:hypothetical protein K490DRAFT_54506 [Saccharata proteae CBS 121410]